MTINLQGSFRQQLIVQSNSDEDDLPSSSARLVMFHSPRMLHRSEDAPSAERTTRGFRGERRGSLSENQPQKTLLVVRNSQGMPLSKNIQIAQILSD